MASTDTPTFTGTFIVEMRKHGDVGWVPFKRETVEYASQETMDAVKQDTYRLWTEKYGFGDADIDGGMVVATCSPRVRLIAEFEAK